VARTHCLWWVLAVDGARSQFPCCAWAQVSVTYSANETHPGEVVDLRVRAARGSCVCVTMVDESIYLLRSGFHLTPTQVRLGSFYLCLLHNWDSRYAPPCRLFT
jgi:hypothetical protein